MDDFNKKGLHPRWSMRTWNEYNLYMHKKMEDISVKPTEVEAAIEARTRMLEANKKAEEDSKIFSFGVFVVLCAMWSKAPVLKNNSGKKPHIAKPPGFAVMPILQFLFSKKTFDKVFLQTILDMQQEYFEALNEGKIWKARWVVFRGYLSLGTTFCTQSVLSPCMKLVKTFTG